jgi:hypothetical protein
VSDKIFHFDDYIVRPMAEQDRNYLGSLIDADAYHMGRMTPDYFLNLVPGEDAWALEDRQGRVIFYFKTQAVCRICIQFSQSDTPEQRERTRDALTKGLTWLEGILQQNNFREMLFDNDGPALKAMAKRRLGFRESSSELIRAIPPRVPTGSAMGPWRAVPQDARKEG